MKSKPIDNIIDQEKEAKKGAKMIKKYKPIFDKLKPFPVGDGKTVFYCTDKKRGEAKVAEYKKKSKIYLAY